MLEKIEQNTCLIEEVRVRKMETFIQESIKMAQVKSLATLQKVRLQTLSASLKNIHVVISSKVLELKEDRGLFNLRELPQALALITVCCRRHMLYCSVKSKINGHISKDV